MNILPQDQLEYEVNDVRLLPKIAMLLQRVNPSDIFSTRNHSIDFKSSRADYISVRTRILSLVFAVLALIWIPIDYIAMDDETFGKFLVLRLIFSLAFLLLALWGGRCSELTVARVRITFFIVVPGLFYLVSHLMLPEVSEDSALLIGYSFLPLLVTAFLAIFPLTLLEGGIYITLSVFMFVITRVVDDGLFTVNALGDLWLLFLLGGIALWVEVTQLYMLMNLYREATRDALTGLVNRRILSKNLEDEIIRSDSYGSDLYVMLFDLDFFKRINDNYGHMTGDRVLQKFGKILMSHCGVSVVVGRYGGEEFLAIVPERQREEVLALAESIRQSCHDVVMRTLQDDREVKFTTSVGVAKRRVNESASELFSRVDEELYRAKSSGRDFVSISKSD